MKFTIIVLLLLKTALVRSSYSRDTTVTPQVSGSTPRIISLFSEIQTDELVGDYIEFVEGDNISLLCNTPDKMPVRYHLPNLTEYKDYNDTDYYARKREGPNHYNKTLFISDAKITDTGSYGCSFYNDPKLSHYIYVFIRSRFGNEHFIPTNANIYLANEKTLVVPCKANKKMNESLVELWTFREEWKGDGIVYDPSFGFQISISETRPIREYLSFSCTYDTGHPEWSHFENKEFFDRNFEVTWEKIGQWKHVGMSLNLACNVQHAREDGDITIRCPRCKNVVFEHYSSLHRLIAVIENLTMEDAGNYECRVLLSNGTLYKQATVNLAVSPTKGQIRIEHVSPEIIILNESHGYRIQVNFTHYPFILGQYNTTWTREYTRAAHKSFVVSEDVSSMAMRSEYNASLASEKLNLYDLKPNQTGTYVLTIQVFDFIKRIKFNVIVQNRKPTVNMTLPTLTNYTILGQKYYNSGARVDFICKIESVPVTNDIKLMSKQPLGHWKQVSPEDLEITHGTYETLVTWDTIVKQSQEVRCTARRGNASSDATLHIGVADGKPTAVSKLVRSPAALTGENEREIYEGDNLELSCAHPINDDWHVVWTHKEEEIPLEKMDISSEGVTRILKISLKNVSATDSEVYTCVLKNSKEKSSLVLPVPFSVRKTQKPILLSPVETNVELQYGQPVNLSCPLSGVPKPRIEWYKDGEPYTLGVSDDNGTLTIQRVTIEDKGVFRCKATNRVGEENVSFTAKVTGGPYTQREFIFGVLLVVVVVLIAVTCFGCFRYKNFKMNKTNKEHVLELGKLHDQLMSPIPTNLGSRPNGLQIPLDQRLAEIAYDRTYELEKEQLTVGDELGVGQFGKVCQGTLTKGKEGTQEPKTVAIKQPLIGSNPEHHTMLVQELKIMCALYNHPNVIALLGAVTKYIRNGELYVVVEYCNYGNLKNYILPRKEKFVNELNEDGTPKITPYVSEDYVVCDRAPSQRQASLPDPTSLSTSDLLSFAMQIANGMNYLANVPCVHRDLALRNVLVTSNLVIRIADFGLARNMHNEYYRMQRKGKETPLPVRWMSIEAIEHGMYTVASDVWSYGIVLYELFSLAGKPYPLVGNEDLLKKLKSGYRSPKPKYAHEEICQLMEQCCEVDPKRRPNFNRCVEVTKNHLRRCNRAMLEHVEAKTKSEEDYQKKLVQWARHEETNYPIRHDSFVALPQMQPKRNSSFLKTVGNFFGGLMKKPSNTTPSAELLPLTETQSLPECHNSNGSVPIAVSHSPSESRPRSEVPSPTESQKHSYLPIGDHPASEAYPLIGSNPPSESYLPIGPYPPSEPHSPV